MPRKDNPKFSPRINNRRALHEYFIEAKVECGMALQGSEVKSLRQGKATLQDAYATVERNELVLHKMHIDPYEKATLAWNHDPKRDRKLLVHKRELRKLEAELSSIRGATLIPLAVYWKNGLAKLELGVAKGKQQHDKRATIRKKEQDREIRRAMSHRQ
jgi:SsrA-binding protein